MKKKIFLTASWDYLLLMNYAVPKNLLEPFLPTECELTLWKNQAFVSLVGFQFNNTKLFKVKWPFFTNFLEINLRFYLSYKGQRAVRFIREFVPSYVIAGIARSTYNEPYKTKRIKTSFKKTDQSLNIEYKMTQRPFIMRATADNMPYIPGKDSPEFFFKEHSLGVGQNSKGQTLLYEVYHPEWRVFPIKKALAQVDWSFFYGSKFAFLSEKKPHSVILAEGSPVIVYNYELA